MKINAALSAFSWKEIVEVDDSANISREKAKEHFSHRLNAQNLVVLLGAGASRAVVVDPSKKDEKAPLISDIFVAIQKAVPKYAEILKKIGLSDSKNFEEILSRCLLFQKVSPDADVDTFINTAKTHIVTATNFLKEKSDLTVFENFLRSITLRSSRHRPNIFTLNYDLAVETAASRIGFTLIDGFSFNHPHSFSPLHFDYDIVRRKSEVLKPVESVAYFYKLHGSINWKMHESKLVRAPEAVANPALIFPTKEKFQDSYNQPFLEMITRLKECLRAQQTTLVVIGYSCGDEHVNSIISNSLDINYDLNALFIDPSIQSNVNYKQFMDRGAIKDQRLTFLEGTMEDFVRVVPVLNQHSKEELFVKSLLKVVGANGAT